MLPMTELLYLPDADDVTSFTASVVETDPEYLVLDGTYFYPEGGGQPADRGRLEWEDGRVRVEDVRKSHGEVRHYIARIDGEPPATGDSVTGRIDPDRRDRLSRMHTAQHLLSRVAIDEFGYATADTEIGVNRSWLEVEATAVSDRELERLETSANELIDEDRPVGKREEPRATVEERVDPARADLGLIPDHVDPLRIVEIEGFDYCPCGGTHVDRLGEIGTIEIVAVTSRSPNVVRLSFELES